MKKVLAAIVLGSSLLPSHVAFASPSILECFKRAHCELHGPCPFPYPCDPPPQASPAVVVAEPVLPPDLPKHVGRSVARHEKPLQIRPWIVVSRNVKTIADLTGKQVSFGLPGSHEQVAGRQLFKKLHIAVNETPLDDANALDGVSTGDIGAVVVWAHTPMPLHGPHYLQMPSTSHP